MGTGCRMLQAPTSTSLGSENWRYSGTGGISQENHFHRFLRAFLDASTGSVYLSRLPHGRTAPIHVFDGLPEKLVLQRAASDMVIGKSW
ncbi:MAG: hypothetical protein ACREX9_11080 [Gammaproteobacteria bacterium]